MSFLRTVVYVINLARSTERWNKIEQRLQDIGIQHFERIDAVDGNQLSAQQWKQVNSQLFSQRNGREILAGEVGCYLSHIKALNTLLLSKFDYALIFEDDAVPSCSLVPIVKQLETMSTQWDFVKFSGAHSGLPKKLRPVHQNFTLCLPFGQHCNLAAQLVNRRFAQSVIDHFLPITVPYDHAIERPWKGNYKFRIISPLPCEVSDGSTSEINTTTIHKFPVYKRLSTYRYRLTNELRRLLWAINQLVAIYINR